MKKFTRTMALALVTAMLLSMTAFAAPTVKPEDGKTVTPGALANGNKSFESITYADGRIVTNGQYMIFVVTPDGGSYVPTASSILYINQKQAAAEDTITFENIFPKEMKNSGIMISGYGLSKPELIAKILAALLGDVNLDEDVTAEDLTAMARHVAKIAELTDDAALTNADVNSDSDTSAEDLTLLARYVAKIIDSFN